MRARLTADYAGRVYQGGGVFVSAFWVPFMQSLAMAGAVGVAVGCAVWLTILAEAAIPVGVCFGACAFCVAFPSFAHAPMMRAEPQEDADETPVKPFEPVILVGGKPARAVTPTAQRNAETPGRFAEFVKACAVDTSVRRLLELGFSRQEQAEWRELLMRAGGAVWNGKGGNFRNGWHLTRPADDILASV
jgi:hypothetical protein